MADADSDSDDEVFGDVSGMADAGDGDDDEALGANDDAAVKRLEMALLMGSADLPPAPALRLVAWAHLVSKGAWAHVLRDPAVQAKLLGPPSKLEALEAGGGGVIVHRRAALWARGGGVAARELAVVAAALVQLYCQVNYAGPALGGDALADLAGLVGCCVSGDLEMAGEAASPHVCLGNALVAARALLRVATAGEVSADWHFKKGGLTNVASGAAAWWASRAAALHARALLVNGQPPEALALEYEASYAAAREWVLELPGPADGDVLARLELECGMAQHHMDRENRGKAAFQRAISAARLEVKLTAALGKRTKYQQRSLPQMRLETTGGVFEPAADPAADVKDLKKKKVLASDVDLNEDSILLEVIKFDDADEAADVEVLAPMSPDAVALRQALVLALCLDVKNSNPDDGLTHEEMRPYVDTALKQASNWLVYSGALYQKCRLESQSVYSADRAALQLQALVEQHATTLSMTQQTESAIEAQAPAHDRVRFVACLAYPAIWDAKRELAHAMASLGALVSAAELFAEIHAWDEVVDCYAHAQKRDEALAVLDGLLVTAATPALWCAYGELKDDPSCFEKAWDMSNGRCFRAARSRAQYAQRNRDADGAAEWFGRALKVRPQSPQSWFNLGIVQMLRQDWPAAGRAFSRAVSQEPDDGDAWANLAAVHLRMHEPKAAFSAYERALAARPDDWRLWENLSRVGAGLRDRPALVLHALNRLLDLRHASKRPVGTLLEQLHCVAQQVAQQEDEFAAHGAAAPTSFDNDATVDPEASTGDDNAAAPKRPLNRGTPSGFNTTRAGLGLDKLLLRVEADVAAKCDADTAELWDLCANRAKRRGDFGAERELRAKQVRALLNAENALTDVDIAPKLVAAAHLLAAAHFGATPQQVRSSALTIRGVAARVATSPAFGTEEAAEAHADELKQAADGIVAAISESNMTSL
ncbi:hypothetical protein M885DRAFT_521627 [Pelagophyceae sp. CCMP2097]|nr:hypothetical protein M885DRAFT_521627 [Pelagophyceae sp. CCMP2097]